MDCENAEKLFPEMIFGELEGEQKAELSEHLAGCPACSETLAAMRRTTELVREGLEAQTPMLSLERREAVLEGAKKPRRTAPGKVKKPRPTRRGQIRLALKTDRLPLFTGIGAAAAGIIFILIIAGMFVPGLYKGQENAKKEDRFSYSKAKPADEKRTIEERLALGPEDFDYDKPIARPTAPRPRRKRGKDVMIADAEGVAERAKAAPPRSMKQSLAVPSEEAPRTRTDARKLDDVSSGSVIRELGGGRASYPAAAEKRKAEKKETRAAGRAPVPGDALVLDGALHSEKSTSAIAQRRELEKSEAKLGEHENLARKSKSPIPVNPFVMTKKNRFSTFSIDVNAASYTRTRSYIRSGYLPPAASVRMEEFINAFDYNYPRQTDKTFAVHAKAATSPFGMALTLLKIGIKGRVLGREGRKPAHLVFVVDASGSMARQDRMPLIQYGLTALVGKLKPRDRVSLVTYGAQARLILEAVPVDKKKQIAEAVRSIQCGGSTNLVEGLALGYSVAGRHFRAGEINRVILCSGGVANVGAADAEQMLKRVETFRNYGIIFSSIGFGMGAYNNALLEKLANSGDGAYSFCDSRAEARRIFVEKMSAEIQTIAKGVKIRVEFNARRIRRYRLIGCENRDIADDRFRDDTADAGEVGSGHSATALYEVELLGTKSKGDLLEHLGKVYVRYRNADTGKIGEISHRLGNEIIRHRSPEKEPRYFLAACAAEFAEILRMSEHAKNGSLAEVQRLLEKVTVKLPLDKKIRELLWMVKRAQGLPRAG